MSEVEEGKRNEVIVVPILYWDCQMMTKKLTRYRWKYDGDTREIRNRNKYLKFQSSREDDSGVFKVERGAQTRLCKVYVARQEQPKTSSNMMD